MLSRSWGGFLEHSRLFWKVVWIAMKGFGIVVVGLLCEICIV